MFKIGGNKRKQFNEWNRDRNYVEAPLAKRKPLIKVTLKLVATIYPENYLETRKCEKILFFEKWQSFH